MKYLLILFCGCFAYSQSAEAVFNPNWKRLCKKPVKSIAIAQNIPEGSGLLAWNGTLWTHNDSGKAQLFSLDTATGKIVNTYDLPQVKNRDWEDLAQDGNFFYVGNFGNNAHNKDTLQIFRIHKQSLLQQKPQIETIAFCWPETINDGVSEKINFDCEAMAIVGDSICLFTKEWQQGHRSRLFTVPKNPGTWIAQYRSTLKTRILVTGAAYDENAKQLVLCGYNLALRPFLLVFPETQGTDFFSKSAQKIKIRKRFRQMEGVATFDGINYYTISEDFHFLLLRTRQQIFKLHLKK